jgi:hypothetical protein
MKPVESSRARCDNGCFSNENVTRLTLALTNPANVGHPPAPRPAVNGVKVVNDDINVLALIKGKERYIFLYDDSQRAEALRMLGRHASNPELSFSWYDAAVLSQKIRQEERQRRSRLRSQVTDSEESF